MGTNQNGNEIKINPAARIIGFNINGLRTLVVYGDLNGLVYETLAFDTPTDKPFLEGFSYICGYADKLLARVQAQHLPLPQVVSLAFNGSLDIDRGLVKPSIDLLAWQSAPIKGRLSMHFNLPVFIEQETNASALAEYYFGAGQGMRNVVFVGLDPAVRMGILFDGDVYHSSGGFAGNIGDMRMSEYGPAGYGHVGSLNGFVSPAGMLELAHLRFPNTWPADLSIETLADHAQVGDQNAQLVLNEAAEWLGKALCPVTRILFPEMYIIGSPAELLGDRFIKTTKNSLRVTSDLPDDQIPGIKPAGLGKHLPQVSALAAAINHYRCHP